MRGFFANKRNVILFVAVLTFVGMTIWFNQVNRFKTVPKMGALPDRHVEPLNPKSAPLPGESASDNSGGNLDEAEKLIKKASENYFFHEFSQGADNYRKAIALYEYQKDFTKAAKTYEALGDLYKFANEPEEAVANYEQAVDYHKRLANPYGQARAMKAIGDFHQGRSQAHQAADWYQKALDVVKEEDPSLILANVQEALGRYNWEQKNLPKAIELYTGARDTFSALQNHFGYDHMNNVIKRLQGDTSGLHSHAARQEIPTTPPVHK